MKDPGRTIPRSILISLVCVAAIYIGINLSITGSVPWRTFVPEDKHPEAMNVVWRKGTAEPGSPAAS